MFHANWKSRSNSRSKSRERDAKYISAALIPSAAFIVNPTSSLEFSNINDTQNNLLNSTLNSSLLGLSSENIDKSDENKKRKESKLSKENSFSNSKENFNTGKQKSLSLRGRKKTKEKPLKKSENEINKNKEPKHGIEIANGLYDELTPSLNNNFKRPETPNYDSDSPIYSVPMPREPVKLIQSNGHEKELSIEEFHSKQIVDSNDLSKNSEIEVQGFFHCEEDFKKSSSSKDVYVDEIDSDENIDFQINRRLNKIGFEGSNFENSNSIESSLKQIPNGLHKSSSKTNIPNSSVSINAGFYDGIDNKHFNNETIGFKESTPNKNTGVTNIENQNSEENFLQQIPNGLHKSSLKTRIPNSTNSNNMEFYAETNNQPNNEHLSHNPIEFKESTPNKNINTNAKFSNGHNNSLTTDYYGFKESLIEPGNKHKNKPIVVIPSEMQYSSTQKVPKPPIKSDLNNSASPPELGFIREDIENVNVKNTRKIPNGLNKTPPTTGYHEFYAEVHNEPNNKHLNDDNIGFKESIQNKNTNMTKSEYNPSNKQVKDEIRSLQDTIYRLNIQLSTHISNNESGRPIGRTIFPGKGPVPSWLLNTKYLAPLLFFYDKRYNEKSAELQKMQLELQNFEKELFRVIKENERLHLKLQENQKGAPFSNQADWQVIVQQAKLVIEENRLLLEEIEIQQLKIVLLENNSFSEMAKLKKSLLTVTSERDALDEEIKTLTQRLAELKGNTMQLSFNQESPKSYLFGSSNESVNFIHQNQLKFNDSVIVELKNDKRKLEQEIDNLKQNEIKQEKKLQKYKKIMESEKKFRDYFNEVLEKSDEVIREHNSLLETYGILNKEIDRIGVKLKAEVSSRTDLNINDQENKFTTKNGDNEFLDKLYFVESLTEMLIQNVNHLNHKCKNQETDINKYQLLLQEKDKYIQECRQENEEIEEKLGNLLKNAADEY